MPTSIIEKAKQQIRIQRDKNQKESNKKIIDMCVLYIEFKESELI